MVRDFHSIIGTEAREQLLATEGTLPTAVVACVGGCEPLRLCVRPLRGVHGLPRARVWPRHRHSFGRWAGWRCGVRKNVSHSILNAGEEGGSGLLLRRICRRACRSGGADCKRSQPCRHAAALVDELVTADTAATNAAAAVAAATPIAVSGADSADFRFRPTSRPEDGRGQSVRAPPPVRLEHLSSRRRRGHAVGQPHHQGPPAPLHVRATAPCGYVGYASVEAAHSSRHYACVRDEQVGDVLGPSSTLPSFGTVVRNRDSRSRVQQTSREPLRLAPGRRRAWERPAACGGRRSE